jgi:protein-L-isoaspartate(D-aspartate) O-methyltransferase
MITIGESERFAALRHRMVETQLRARDIRDERVLQAMARVPRHQFAPEQYRGQAYEDHPLPIGEGQTISQPYMVALMLDFLELRPADRALEVGTGSGYVTALLAELALHVVSVERHAALANDARMLLAVMGYSNVTVIVGDGSRGWPDFAPYDAIIVSAAASAVPPDLVAIFDC